MAEQKYYPAVYYHGLRILPGVFTYRCGYCDAPLEKNDERCPRCGCKVNWFWRTDNELQL